ncbi:hypothetical protein BH24ACT7_BH24ACT7_23720 [soil metagenome]
MKPPEVLIEQWLPTKELGIESVRERAAASALPPIYFLHVWWARRPLVASAGAVLASLMPAWTPQLAERFAGHTEIATETAYRKWFLRLCGILGDPIVADRLTRAARQSGERIPNPYTYKQAYKNSPTAEDLELLHRVLEATWGRTPEVADPTAGGGSIPYEAIRYGLPAFANDLNPIAAAVLRAGVDLPAKYGHSLVPDLQKWGGELCRRVEQRLVQFFPSGPDGQVATYLFARTVACPRTGKPVPLAPNWWLSKDKGGTAVRLVTQRDGVDLDQPEFEIIRRNEIDTAAAGSGTITRGKAISPWDGLVIDGDHIKQEARAGRMGSILYAVAVRTPKGRGFRAPTPTDLEALAKADTELGRVLPGWETQDTIPDETRFIGPADRSANYGITSWRNMFSARQLLVHGTFVEEYRNLIPEVRDAIAERDRADAVLALLALVQGKAVSYNAYLSSWNVSREVMRSVFDRHDFAFKWTYGEFEGARELYPWGLDQIVDAYRQIADLLHGTGSGFLTTLVGSSATGSVTVQRENAGDLSGVVDGSFELVCIDPPYYDNVMYAELADFFYVWEKRTLGLLWPDLFVDELTDKDEEAVANEARFAHAGRRKKELATLDYKRKMTAIFAECRRVLTDTGVMTVMFTHKKADAWDTLGQSLLDAGFTIEASWPVPTESEHSLHQAKKNSAASTIFLVCRKRAERTDDRKVHFSAIESEVRDTAREAYSRFTDAGIGGVDLLLATYGPALSVLSEHWPVYSTQPGIDAKSRLLRPDEALAAAREEVIRLQRNRLVSSHGEFDPYTDFWLLAWDTFRARQFPFDEARKLALAVGGADIDDLTRAKVLDKKAGSVTLSLPQQRYRRDADSDLAGVNRDRVAFPVLLDALHTALYVLDHDGAAAARTWLDQRGLTTGERFGALLEAAVRAVPRVREKGELLLDEAVLLERLVLAAFPGFEMPVDEVTVREGQLSLGE